MSLHTTELSRPMLTRYLSPQSGITLPAVCTSPLPTVASCAWEQYRRHGDN